MVGSRVRALTRVLGTTALLLGGAAPALSAQTFIGQILDAQSRLPLASVSVQLSDSTGTTHLEATTDATGRFTFHLGRPGTYVIRADAAGYTSFISEPLRLAELQTRTIEIHMPSVVTQLDPVVVTGERAPNSIGLQRFEEHRQRGLGYFLERQDIEEKAPNTFTDVMWGIPGVQVVPMEDTARPINAPPMRPGTTTLRMRGNMDCAPSLYIDGMLFGNVDYVSDGGIDDLVYAPDVEAIEVYRGASEVPPDLNTGAPGCGVIAVWTRRDRSDDQRADKLLSAGVGLTVPLDRGILQVVSRAGPWDRYRFTMRFRLGIYETSGTLGPETPLPPDVESEKSEYISAYFGVQGPPLLLPWKRTAYMRVAGGGTFYGPHHLSRDQTEVRTDPRVGVGAELALGFRVPRGSPRPWVELGVTSEYVFGAGWDVAGLLLLFGLEFGSL
jgi:hypothetical protein